MIKKIGLAVFVLLGMGVLSASVFADGMFVSRGPTVWKDIAVEFRQVSETPKEGFKPMTLVESPLPQNGQTYYVAANPVLTLQDVALIDLNYNMRDRDRVRLYFTFHTDGKTKLTDYTTAHVGEILGVIIDGKLRCIPHIGRVLNNGKLQLTGFLPNEAVDIARRFYAPRMDAIAPPPAPAPAPAPAAAPVAASAQTPVK